MFSLKINRKSETSCKNRGTHMCLDIVRLTQKSTILKEHVLRQHAGWSGRSQMHLKYLHYFGNESSESLLEAYGIITKDNN